MVLDLTSRRNPSSTYAIATVFKNPSKPIEHENGDLEVKIDRSRHTQLIITASQRHYLADAQSVHIYRIVVSRQSLAR